MKKLLVVAAALMLIVPAVSNAQGIKMTQSEFNKAGKISLSGNLVEFNNVKNEDSDDSPSTMGVGADVGYMVIDNVQLNLGLMYMSATDGADSETKTSGYGLTIGARYYLDMLSKNNLFPSVGASYMMGSTTLETGGNSGDIASSSIKAGVGITQAMGGAQGGHLNLMIDYQMNTTTPDGGDDVKDAGINVGVGFGLYF